MHLMHKIMGLMVLASVVVQAQESGHREARPIVPSAKLLQAEQLADSVMKRLHTTLDFEPVLGDVIAPELSETWSKELPRGAREPEFTRAVTAALTILYLEPLLQASLKMDGVRIQTDDDLPPDVKAALESIGELTAMTPRQLQEFIKHAQAGRLAMLKHIRRDVWNSEAYTSFLKKYPDESRIATESDSDVKDLQSISGTKVRGLVYIVRREGFAFMIVERDGVMKVADLAPVWMD
jgi:hypothetical protein